MSTAFDWEIGEIPDGWGLDGCFVITDDRLEPVRKLQWLPSDRDFDPFAIDPVVLKIYLIDRDHVKRAIAWIRWFESRLVA